MTNLNMQSRRSLWGQMDIFLKNSITQEALEKEICSVYKKISTRIGEKREISSERETAVHGMKNGGWQLSKHSQRNRQ